MKTEIIPVVVGALGVIKRRSEKIVREIPGNNNLWKIQKTTLLGTVHILQKVLPIKWLRKTKQPLSAPRFKVWAQLLEKKYGLVDSNTF